MKSTFMKAPSSKLQHPEKLQTANTNQHGHGNFGAWCLKFLWSLDVGAWSFEPLK
jgi:hypothetical protein